MNLSCHVGFSKYLRKLLSGINSVPWSKLKRIRKTHTERSALKWAALWASKFPKLDHLLSPRLTANLLLFSPLLNTNHRTMTSPAGRYTFSFFSIASSFRFFRYEFFFGDSMCIRMNFTAPYVQYQTLACIKYQKLFHEFSLKKASLAIQVGALLAAVRVLLSHDQYIDFHNSLFSWVTLLNGNCLDRLSSQLLLLLEWTKIMILLRLWYNWESWHLGTSLSCQ